MKLRIVTATRGESPFWADAVASIRATAAGAEHVIVCPVARVASVAATAAGARVIAEERPGLYAALNTGLRAAPSDWDAFTWLNDDDQLVAPGFGAVVAAGTDATYGRVELIDGRGGRIGELPVARRGGDLAPLLARGLVPLAQPGTVIRRAVWEKLGGFDETYRLAGDLDFFVRALAGGAQFKFVAQTAAAFRLTAGQLSKERETGDREKLRALEPLASTPRDPAALWRFRAGNLAVYFERLRRHGFVSMQTLYERTT
jgi:glycosyltransferase